MRLGHVRLNVEDLDRMADFYTAAFGLTVHERASDDAAHYAFLADETGMHHRLVLRKGREGGAPGPPTRFDHLAFEVETETDFLEAVERLRALGAETDLQEARIAWQCYTHDPEGLKVEVYVDRRERPDGAPFWKGRQSDLDEARVRASLR